MPSTETKQAIRIIKEWEYGGVTYPIGHLLNASEKAVEELVRDGYAEVYEAKAGDVPYVSPVGGNMNLNDVEAVVRRIAQANQDAEEKGKIPSQEVEYMKTGGFKSMAHFCTDIARAGPQLESMSESLKTWFDRVSKAPTGLGESIGADGGFLVPVEFKNEILRIRLEASILRARSRIIPMQTNTVKIPYVAETTRASSVFGGVIIYRPEEAGSKTASKPKLGQLTLTLFKMIGLVYATDELLQDSPVTLQPLLTSMFAEAMAFQEEEDFVNGTGAGMPLGVLNAPCLVAVAKETGQAADTINLDNILKMWSRMWHMSHGNAIWLANSDAFPQLAKLAIAVGTGGSAAGLIGSDATGAPTSTILGRPLNLNPHCQTVGDEGDIILGDFSQYLIGEKVGRSLQVDTSIHVRFVNDETAFRFVMRYDGKPWWASALTPKHGTNTLSPFVTLAARA